MNKPLVDARQEKKQRSKFRQLVTRSRKLPALNIMPCITWQSVQPSYKDSDTIRSLEEKNLDEETGVAVSLEM
jgi:hypothetical protein